MAFVSKTEMYVKLIKIKYSKVRKLFISGRLIVNFVFSNIFIPLIWYGYRNTEPIFFGIRFVKKR